MSISIPARPPEFQGNPDDPNYQANLMNWQQEMTNWQMIVQAAQNEQNRESQMASNLEEASRKAIEAITGNMRG